MSGWIKAHRDFLESSMWLDEPFTRGQAWIDLIALANHKSGFIRIRGNRIDLERGQCGWSQTRLSERWKWSRKKTRSWLKELEKDERIIIKGDSKTSVITICNYSKYQDKEPTECTAEDTVECTAEEPQRNRRGYTNKNEKKKKKEKKEDEKTLPDFITEKDWNDFREMRIRIKQPMTENAEVRMIDRLTKFHKSGYDVSAIINNSIINNWKDVFEPKHQAKPNTDKRKVALR